MRGIVPAVNATVEWSVASGIYFPVKDMPADRYDEVIRRLQQAGAGRPAGRSYHCAFDGEGGLHVFDVWDSPGGPRPLRSEADGDPRRARHRPGEPMISEVHNIIIG